MTSSKPWWMTDDYSVDHTVPPVFDQFTGPKGLALVKAWPDGRTQKGWGLNPPKGEAEGFMPRYNRGEFNDRRVLYGYARNRWAFAFIMRALKLVCVDIDGKNGGFVGAKKLGPLPKTLAETSKSGNGYHLFYSVDEEWDEDKGFGLLADRIGIEEGVDIRATGCVYHHENQMWNGQGIAPLPAYLQELLLHREQKVSAAYQHIDAVLSNGDDMEVLMMHDALLDELKKPIPSGKRNITLFAIGNKMRQAEVPGWDDLLRARASDVGLPDDEVEKLVSNISTYGSPVGAP